MSHSYSHGRVQRIFRPPPLAAGYAFVEFYEERDV